MDYGRILSDEFRRTPEGRTISLRIDPTSRELFAKFSDGSEKQMTGTSAPGSENSVTLGDSDAFRTLVTNSQLTAGTQYKFPFTTTHEIPGTSTIHNGTTENILVLATSNNTYSNLVVSESFPDDVIVVDLTDIVAEDSSTARDGKILFRSDTKNELIAHFDFRNVLFRRYAIDLASIPDYPSSTAVTTGNFFKIPSTNKIVRVTGNFTTDAGATQDNKFTVDIVDYQSNVGGIYLSHSQTTYTRGYVSLPVDNADFVDVTCFGSTLGPGNRVKISIGKNHDGDPALYNNVVFVGNQSMEEIVTAAGVIDATFGGAVIKVNVGIDGTQSDDNYLIQQSERCEIGGGDNYTVINCTDIIARGLSSNMTFSGSQRIDTGTSANLLEYHNCYQVSSDGDINANTYNICSYFVHEMGSGNIFRSVQTSTAHGQCNGNNWEDLTNGQINKADGCTITSSSEVVIDANASGNNINDASGVQIGTRSSGNNIGQNSFSGQIVIGIGSSGNTIDGSNNSVKDSCSGNTIDGNENSIDSNSNGNTLQRAGFDIFRNKVGRSCNSNVIEGDGNTIEDNCNSNNILTSISEGNILRYTCNGNDITGSFNVIGENSSGNDILNGAQRCSMGSFCNSNIITGLSTGTVTDSHIGNNSNSNQIRSTDANTYRNNEIGSQCNSNIIDDANESVIGADSNTNQIERGDGNKIGSTCQLNDLFDVNFCTIASLSNANTIENSVLYPDSDENHIGSKSNSNIISGGQKNTISNNAGGNTLDDCAGCTIGVEANSNDLDNAINCTIGNGSDGNTISPSGIYGSALSNSLGNDCENNTIHGSRNVLENGCEDIVCDDAVNPISIFNCYFAPGTRNKNFTSGGAVRAIVEGFSMIIPANTATDNWDIDTFDYSNRVVFAASNLGSGGTQLMSMKGEFTTESALFEQIP